MKTFSTLTLATALFLSLPVFASDGHSGALQAAHHEPPAGMNADQALGELKAGNQRFIEGKLKSDKADAHRRKTLAEGQKPNAIILSCSDSRVPPELVFDQGLGEIFTVRVAGNVLGAATVASIEYAVEHLGTRLIVVLGHESCGAVKAALTTPPGKSAGSADLDVLVSSIQPALSDVSRSIASEDKTLRRPVRANVEAVAKRLVTRSSIIRKSVESGEVKIVPGIYSLESGMVEFWSKQ